MIGGEYYLKLKPVDDSLLYSISSICPSYAYFSSGRDAIYSVLANLPAQRIWLPNFICKAIVDVATQAGKELLYYPITEQLVPQEEWLTQVQSGDIVFLTHLFGILQTSILSKLADTGAVVVSDLTQTVYHLTSWQSVVSKSTFILASLRKTMAVPDGAFVGSLRHDVASAREPAGEGFWVPRAAALLSRGGSANQGFMSDENHALFQQAERWIESHPAAARKISDCARSLLSTYSEEEWEVQRKQTHHNQAILATHLSDKVVCPQVKPTRTLPEIAVSSFFTILVDPAKRDKLRTVLANQRIYCPVHWDTSFLEHEHPLSQKILSLPCDARYTNRDMKYIAGVVTAQLS